jgi:hypothetical protein
MRRQAGNAACAARAAWSTSAALDSGHSAITSPVAGLRTTWTLVASEATHSPPM